MPNKSWRRHRSYPEIGRRARRRDIAIGGALVAGAIVLGVQLGNSAIADIHPVHRNSLAVRLPALSTQEIERRARGREPDAASLHGWDQARADAAEPDIEVFSEPAPVYEAAVDGPESSEPDFRGSTTEGKDGVEDYELDAVKGGGK